MTANVCDSTSSYDKDAQAVPSDSINLVSHQNDIKQLLVKEEDLIVAKLYCNPAFPRNLVDSIVKYFSDYLSSPFFDHLRELVSTSLDPSLPDSTKNDIESMFGQIMKPFSHLQTEYQRLKYFEKCGDYIPPITYKIHSREERVKSKDGFKLQMKDVVGQLIPLRRVLKRFFELPDVLSDTLSYMKSVEAESDLVSNIIQCKIWKRKMLNFDETSVVIPINIYYDECEPNSALGPHCEPLGCTYLNVPVLPFEWNSRLENIFLACLFDSDNRTLYGNKKCFQPLIDELLFLEKVGVTVNSPNLGSVHVHFFSVLLGDNKGLNGICGWVESFTANFYCRICSCPKSLTDFLYEEDPKYLRTVETYAHDIAQNDASLTGIKEECVFNKIPSFQTPLDISVDEFHDVVEGVAHYTMLPVLLHFDSLNRMFLPTLNSRLFSINLGVDSDNRPPLIDSKRLSKAVKLKMTGAEMTLFVRIFGVLVIDMIPEGDPFYQLYLYLHDILSFVHAKAVPKEADVLLSLVVKDHHKLYVQLTKENLKPKHHFLLHYGKLIKRLGPFRPLSTIRFEAKHHLILMTANTCMSRVNLSRTVAIKQQLAFCQRSLSNESLRHPAVSGPCHLIDLKETEMFASLPDSLCENSQTLANWVIFKGTKYEPKQVVLTGINDIGLFNFAEIKLIIIHDDIPVFVCCPFTTLGVHSLVRGYEVKRSEVKNNWLVIKHDALLDPHPLCLYTLKGGNTVVVLKCSM